jgi:hypothetical protein
MWGGHDTSEILNRQHPGEGQNGVILRHFGVRISLVSHFQQLAVVC